MKIYQILNIFPFWQKDIAPKEDLPKILAYKYEQVWTAEGIPQTVLYISKKSITKEQEQGDGVASRNEGNWDRNWNQQVQFKSFIVVCVSEDHCRVKVAVTLSGHAPADTIYSGRIGDVTIGRESFKLDAKSQKAKDLKVCSIKTYKKEGTCP